MSLFSTNEEQYCTPFALHNNKNTRRGQIRVSRLEPENEFGNVEYKLRLTDPTPERVERLVTQLKWRIREGKGEAIIYLGVKDNGLFVGLTPEETRLSLHTLEKMASKIGATMTVVNERIVDPSCSDENENPDSTTSQQATSSSVLSQQAPPTSTTSVSSTTTTTNDDSNSNHLAMSSKGKISRNPGKSKYKEKHIVTSTINLTSAAIGSSSSSISNTATQPCNDTITSHNQRSKKFHSSGRSKLYQKKPVIRKVIQVLVKRKTHDISEELRVAVLGPTESGKSSLLGVLSRGEYDNGRGSARLNLFRHRHEVRSGHTSSISQEIFGFDAHGKPLTYKTCFSTEEIIESSSKIVTLVDLAGHQRYLGTTLFGLGSHSPDFVLLVVNALSPITSMTTDHISLAIGMEKPSAIVINKIDLAAKEDQENCYTDLVEALRELHPNVIPFRIWTLQDAILAGTKSTTQCKSNSTESKSLPIFFTSCVTGTGLSALYAFFNEISPDLNQNDLNHALSKSSELQVDETFEVPGIGTVVSGLMIEGIIREGDEMLLGPDDQGNFSRVSIASLQRHKIPCNYARAGQKCTMAIVGNNIRVRRGMVMKEVDNEWNQSFSICLQFQANIKFITIKQLKLNRGSQVSIYVGNVRQTCTILSISQTTNNSYLVDLKLTKRPEYIREMSKLIMRYGLTKAIGTVTKVIPMTKR